MGRPVVRLRRRHRRDHGEPPGRDPSPCGSDGQPSRHRCHFPLPARNYSTTRSGRNVQDFVPGLVVVDDDFLGRHALSTTVPSRTRRRRGVPAKAGQHRPYRGSGPAGRSRPGVARHGVPDPSRHSSGLTAAVNSRSRRSRSPVVSSSCLPGRTRIGRFWTVVRYARFTRFRVSSFPVVQRGLFDRWTAHPDEPPTNRPDLGQLRARLDRIPCPVQLAPATGSAIVLDRLDALQRPRQRNRDRQPLMDGAGRPRRGRPPPRTRPHCSPCPGRRRHCRRS